MNHCECCRVQIEFNKLHAHHIAERAATVDVPEQEFVATIAVCEENRTVTKAGFRFYRNRCGCRSETQICEKRDRRSWRHADGSVVARDAQGRGRLGRFVTTTSGSTSWATLGVSGAFTTTADTSTAATTTTTASTAGYKVKSRAGARGRLRFVRLCGQRRFGWSAVAANPWHGHGRIGRRRVCRPPAPFPGILRRRSTPGRRRRWFRPIFGGSDHSAAPIVTVVSVADRCPCCSDHVQVRRTDIRPTAALWRSRWRREHVQPEPADPVLHEIQNAPEVVQKAIAVPFLQVDLIGHRTPHLTRVCIYIIYT